MPSISKSISVSELRDLEARPKTVLGKILDRVICLLPLLLTAVIIIVYKLAPNNGENLRPLYIYQPSDLYTGFMGVFLAGFAVWNVLAVFYKKAFDRLRYGAPIYSAVFAVLLFYDILTLKAAVLRLPFFPWIDAVLSAIWYERSTLWDSTWHSLLLLFSGYFAGSLAGLVTGIIAGTSKKARYWITPVIKVLGPIPSTTFIPIVVTLAATLFQGSVFLIALGVWYPVAMTTINGVLNIPQSHFEAARTFGAGKAQLLFQVAIPAAMPFIFQGLTQGMSIACIVLLVAETLGVESGLGWYINATQATAAYASMFGAIVVICITFFTVNAVLNAFKKRVLRWQPQIK